MSNLSKLVRNSLALATATTVLGVRESLRSPRNERPLSSPARSILRVVDVYREKKKQYPRLGRAGSLGYLRDVVLPQEQVTLKVAPLPNPAQLYNFRGEWTILLNSRETDPSRKRWFILHELAHLWIHHDPVAPRNEVVYSSQNYENDDPREADAELFCMLAFNGPRPELQNGWHNPFTYPSRST
jgi:hypothetical protein